MSLLQQLSSAAAAAMPILLDLAAKSFAILFLTALIALSLRRASAAARHLAWFLGAFSLLLLPILTAALPSWHILPQWTPAASAQVSETSNPLPASQTNLPPLDTPLPAQKSLAPMTPPAPVPTISPITPTLSHPWVHAWSSLSWQSWALLTWATLTLFLLARIVLGFLSLRWLEHRSTPIRDPESLTLLLELRNQLALRRPVHLLGSQQRTMPMTWGLWHTRLLLPAASCSPWSPDQLRTILLHELAHARRWDCLTQLITQIACALYWFNPLLWLAWHRMQAERERACDDLVLNTGTRPSTYAQQLLHIASDMPADRYSAAAIAMARPTSLEGRLLAILDVKRNRRVLTWGSVAVIVLLLSSVVLPLAAIHRVQADATTAPGDSKPINTTQSVARTVTYRLAIHLADGGEVIQKIMVKDGRQRSEMANGTVSIQDDRAGRDLIYHPPSRFADVPNVAYVYTYDPAVKSTLTAGTIEGMADPDDRPVEQLGTKQMAGREVEGIRFTKHGIPVEVWRDATTHHPVQIEDSLRDEAGHDLGKMTFSDIVFDAPLADALFSVRPPAGYQVVESARPKAATQPATKSAYQPSSGAEATVDKPILSPADDDYRRLYGQYKDLIAKAAEDGDRVEIARLTRKFNKSIGGRLLHVRLHHLNAAGKLDLLTNESFGAGLRLVPAVSFDAGKTIQVVRLDDSVIVGNNLDGQLAIRLDFKPLSTAQATDMASAAITATSPASQPARTATYHAVIQQAGHPDAVYNAMVKDGRDRIETPDGKVLIHNAIEGKALVLDPMRKTAVISTLTDVRPDNPAFSPANLEKLADPGAYPVVALGKKQFGGRDAEGVQFNISGELRIVWRDTLTHRPIQIETSVIPNTFTVKSIHVVYSDIVFDVPLDDSLFATKAPEGYETKAGGTIRFRNIPVTAPTTPPFPATAQATDMASAAITFHVDENGNRSKGDLLQVNDPQVLARLASFFPEMGQGKKSNRAGAWMPSVTIRFLKKDGTAITIVVDQKEAWSEGKGDWNVQGDLKTYLKELRSKPTSSPSTNATSAKSQPTADRTWLTGMWINERNDKPGPQEPTYYILQLGADGSWAWAGLWGTPQKPVKAVIYGRGTDVKLDRLPSDWETIYRDQGAANWLPKPEFSLSLLEKGGSSMSLGALARKDADTIIFHNIESIHWTTEYRRASTQLQASLQTLFANAPFPARESLTRQRNRLLSEAEATLHQGLLKLAETYPQLKQTNQGPLADRLATVSPAGELRLAVGHYPRTPGKSDGTDEAVPEADRYSFILLLTPCDSSEQMSSEQRKSNGAYHHLGLEQRLSISATNPQLAVPLNELAARALAPLASLEKIISGEKPTTQLTTP